MTLLNQTQTTINHASLVATLQALQHQAERLEQEATLIRHQVTDLLQSVTQSTTIVATFTIEGECYEITQAEVEAARAKLVKPWSNEAIFELVLTQKVAERTRHLSPSEQFNQFFDTVITIQNEAIANGTTLVDEQDAAIGD